jgi:hypothetical protein
VPFKDLNNLKKSSSFLMPLALVGNNMIEYKRIPQRVFIHHGVTYVPHFKEPLVYVGPGIRSTSITPKGLSFQPFTYTIQELVLAGAKPSELNLWTAIED